MNILIIGNGFDLAHQLPTKYTDFLDFLGNVRVLKEIHSEEIKRLNIPLHTTFYCFIKLLVNHAFTSFKPFHLFRISQAYIYNSALSCIIRIRKISRLRPIKSPRRLI